MSVTLIRFAQLPTMPWKNGLGVTTQLAIHPEDASTDAFEWRVSIARLDGSAMFSTFAGVERCLAMLEGEMTLLREDEPPVTLTESSEPLRFPGDVRAEGCVTSSSFDLNLMYRPSRWHAAMKRVHAASGTKVQAGAGAMLCSRHPARIAAGGRTFECSRFDMLRAEGGAQFDALSDIDAWLIEVRERHS